jgi:hypothetical protein
MRELHLRRPFRLPGTRDAAPLPGELHYRVRSRYSDFVAQNDGRQIPLPEQLAFRADLLDELMPDEEGIRHLAGSRGFDRVYYQDILGTTQPIQVLVARRLGLSPIQALAGAGMITEEYKRRLRRVSGSLGWTQLLAADPVSVARFAGSPSPEPRAVVPHLVSALVRLRLVNLLKANELAIVRHNMYLPPDTPFAQPRWEGARRVSLRDVEQSWDEYSRA